MWSNKRWSCCDYQKADYFPITVQPGMFCSFYTTEFPNNYNFYFIIERRIMVFILLVTFNILEYP